MADIELIKKSFEKQKYVHTLNEVKSLEDF